MLHIFLSNGAYDEHPIIIIILCKFQTYLIYLLNSNECLEISLFLSILIYFFGDWKYNMQL